MDLDCLIDKAEEALIATVISECCLSYSQNVRYGKLEPCTTTVTSECCLPYGQNVEATSLLISISAKTFATTIGNVHSAIENVNDTLEPSPIITSPPNLRSHIPLYYSNRDHSFDDYNEESTKVLTDISPELNVHESDTEIAHEDYNKNPFIAGEGSKNDKININQY
ncbi:hypothetical protein C1645_820421 [Glomus cerebriforme]|uniref:Uncharacterized protein n=1 Tax=Glomus cerebriforme TaxID=658196 RepID=A0A397T8J4_9GLOM|nr:hypothetical protein C1645_820421 [Glomus cerebriforme]